MHASAARVTFRFGDFELDVGAYCVRHEGRRLKLGKQPMDLLILLVESRGQLVSRNEIIERLWGKDVFVDAETGINTAISKIRQALRDSADTPAFVETVPGKGYRFIATVELVSTAAQAPVTTSSSIEGSGRSKEARQENSRILTSSHIEVSGSERRWNLQKKLMLAALLVLLAAAIVAGSQTWRRSIVPASRATIAVLPFENLGKDPELQYLADGFTAETGASLAQVDPDHLSVRGRTSRYRGTTKTVSEIGRELSVDYLVESSIRAEGTRMRVTTTLIRVGDQEHVWSQSYERELKSLLGLEQELSTAIAHQVRFRLAGDSSGLARRQTQNAEAFDEYLRARYLVSRRTPEANRLAVQHYNRAIALDANYALAWAALAMTYGGSPINSDADPLQVLPQVREASARAVQANENLPETQLAAGYVNWMLVWDWKASETAFRQAINLDPSNAAAHRLLGHALSQMGRASEAESEMRRARELDPLDGLNHALSAQTAFQGRDYVEATRHARQAIMLDSTLWIGYLQLAQAYEALNENQLALAALEEAAQFSAGNSKVPSLKGYVLAKTKRTKEARAILQSLLSRSREMYVPPYAIALVYAGLGEPEAVFAWLEKAYAARDIHLIFLPVDSKWDRYRSDHRFHALLSRCGFVQTPETKSRAAK
ncbi:MAG TPA: winged helix-turn-helix domain-containing protein [Terriglobales bacterium]|nr:winged helix-turn-helix domain-containing protein [Terriglobales bacterium]